MNSRFLVFVTLLLLTLPITSTVTAGEPVISPDTPDVEEPKGKETGKGKEREKGGKKTASFTDDEGTQWTDCAGKCKLKAKKHKRGGGADEIVLTITNVDCENGFFDSCDCVLFKKNNKKGLTFVKEFSLDKGESGIHSIGQQNSRKYTVKCCE